MACAGSLRLVGGGLLGMAATAAAAAGLATPPLTRDVPVSIDLRPRVQVEQAGVRLGDIAFLTAPDLALLRALMAVPIGAAPRAGSPVAVGRDTVMRWVESRGAIHAGEALPSIHWGGADETVIETAAQELAGEAIIDAASSALRGWLKQRSVRAQVQVVSTVRDLVLPLGRPMLRVRPLADQVQPARRMLVWTDVWVEGRFIRTVAVAFEVNAWALASVATSPLSTGAPIDGVTLRGATEAREVDLTAIPDGRPARLESADAGSQGLRRQIKAGEVLTDSRLQPALAVTRGNRARLQVRSGDVLVESRVEVLQDGRPGQLVRVKVAGSGGEVLARVTGPGQVEVQP